MPKNLVKQMERVNLPKNQTLHKVIYHPCFPITKYGMEKSEIALKIRHVSYTVPVATAAIQLRLGMSISSLELAKQF